MIQVIKPLYCGLSGSNSERLEQSQGALLGHILRQLRLLHDEDSKEITLGHGLKAKGLGFGRTWLACGWP